MADNSSFTAISLFSGMGGLDLGLKSAGFKILYQLDIDPYCMSTLKNNWPNTLQEKRDIANLAGQDILRKVGLKKGEVDLIAGGPSCQPFSRSYEGKRKGIKDSRGKSIFEYQRIINEINPRVFLMENVQGLISSNGGKDFQSIISGFNKMDYQIRYKIINAAEYGIPQSRKRLFIVGLEKGLDFDFPRETHGPNLIPFTSSKSAIGDLDDGDIHDGAKSIGGKYGHLINKIPPGMNYYYYTDKYNKNNALFKYRSKFWTFLLKLDPNKPSTTIQARPWDSVGPFHWNNRRLSIREIRRLQTIPDDNYIEGSINNHVKDYRSMAWQQVGNAVPPALSKIISSNIMMSLS